MLRLLSLPFAVLLGVISFGLIGAGVAMLGDIESRGSGNDGGGGLLDVDLASSDENEADESAAIAGASMVGFGILGLIAAIALGIAALSSGKKEIIVAGAAPQQQQQQVVVITDGNARVEQGGSRHDR